MPEHLTTIRGRGALGDSSQKLCDIFWVMTSSNTNSRAIQALLHMYVIVAAADVKTDQQMMVSYGFPLNTFSATASTDLKSENDGAVALATGMKLYIAGGV